MCPLHLFNFICSLTVLTRRFSIWMLWCLSLNVVTRWRRALKRQSLLSPCMLKQWSLSSKGSHSCVYHCQQNYTLKETSTGENHYTWGRSCSKKPKTKTCISVPKAKHLRAAWGTSCITHHANGWFALWVMWAPGFDKQVSASAAWVLILSGWSAPLKSTIFKEVLNLLQSFSPKNLSSWLSLHPDTLWS